MRNEVTREKQQMLFDLHKFSGVEKELGHPREQENSRILGCKSNSIMDESLRTTATSKRSCLFMCFVFLLLLCKFSVCSQCVKTFATMRQYQVERQRIVQRHLQHKSILSVKHDSYSAPFTRVSADNIKVKESVF